MKLNYKSYYLLAVSISILFSQYTVSSQTSPPVVEKKPSLLILGSYHMDNPGADLVNMQTDDVLNPQRQREIGELMKRLKRFRPTKIAVEVSTKEESKLLSNYQKYLNNEYQLGRNEVDQVGFRLAKEMNLKKVYPVDWNDVPPVDISTLDFETFAENNGQKPLLE
ncbi:MAG: DUF5694 domain-containing protein, partial [Acidobacteriota bacterium]